MSFRRQTAPPEAEEPSNLAADLAAIGMVLGVAPSRRAPNIEDTLIRGSIEALERDFRLLAPLVLWFRVHHLWVNAARLTRLARDQASPRVRAFWAGVGRWKRTDHRFARMIEIHRRPQIVIPGDGPEDPRFRRGPIRIPASATRERAADVLSPAMLARRHAAYRWRLIIGPSYRADMWAALEAEPALTPSELARRAYGSFATAWNVKRDYELTRPRHPRG
jgi:hypothetical protein